MQVRIIKTPPAYVIDGFDVRGMLAGHVYDVDPRMANYLVLAGFAIRTDDNNWNLLKRRQTDKAEPSTPS